MAGDLDFTSDGFFKILDCILFRQLQLVFFIDRYDLFREPVSREDLIVRIFIRIGALHIHRVAMAVEGHVLEYRLIPFAIDSVGTPGF